jgi:hypothetical protein
MTPYQIDFSDLSSDEPTHNVLIRIECSPQFADWILALSTPLALNGHFTQSALALPEALIMLGKFLDLSDLPYAHWSQTSRALVDHFIADMNAYNEALHFNYQEWLEQFLTELDRLAETVGTEVDRNLFAVVRSVVEQIAEGQITASQKSLYCEVNGIPLSFRDWVGRVLFGGLSNRVVEQAHLGAFDPGRLIEILNKWFDLGKDAPPYDKIPF